MKNRITFILQIGIGLPIAVIVLITLQTNELSANYKLQKLKTCKVLYSHKIDSFYFEGKPSHYLMDGAVYHGQTVEKILINPEAHDLVLLLENGRSEEISYDSARAQNLQIPSYHDSIIIFNNKEVEKVPHFNNGQGGWQEYLKDNIDPEVIKKNGAPQGTYPVLITFIINPQGKVINAKAENDPGYGTTTEAIKLALNEPKWLPAAKDGNNVYYFQRQLVIFEVKNPSIASK